MAQQVKVLAVPTWTLSLIPEILVQGQMWWHPSVIPALPWQEFQGQENWLQYTDSMVDAVRETLPQNILEEENQFPKVVVLWPLYNCAGMCMFSSPTYMCIYVKRHEDGSVVKSTSRSSRRLRFDFPHTCSGSQLSVTPALGELMPSFSFHRNQACMWYRQTCRQNTHTHNNKIKRHSLDLGAGRPDPEMY